MSGDEVPVGFKRVYYDNTGKFTSKENATTIKLVRLKVIFAVFVFPPSPRQRSLVRE